MNRRRTAFFALFALLVVLMCVPASAASKNVFKKSGSHIVYYDSKGSIVKGKWFKVSKKYYYADAEGYLATGLTKIGTKLYYFDSKGVCKTGWKTINGKKYYFKSADRSAAIGLFKFKSGKIYYFDKSGVMKTGWGKLNGHYYFFKDYIRTGWVTIKGNRYYLIKASSSYGQRASGIFAVGGKLYYFDPATGIMQKNTTVTYNGNKFDVGADGTCTLVKESDAISNDMLFFLKFESGSEAYNQTGGDNGNACGAYQFDNRYSLLGFVKYAYSTNPVLCKEFKTYASYTDGTKLKSNTKFYTAWHTIYKRNKSAFSDLQDRYARINYYDNAERLLTAAGIDIVARPDVVKGAVYSYSIQHGQTTAVNAVKACKISSATSNADFLKKLYDYRIKKFPAYKTRYTQEYNLALAILNTK